LGSIAGGRADADSNGGTITSEGSGSVALGVANGGGLIQATGAGSFAVGSAQNDGASILASGDGSIAMGRPDDDSIHIIASGKGSIAMGLAMGQDLKATGVASVAIGDSVQALADSAFALGLDFTNSTASTFQVGFSATPTLTVTATNVGIGTTAPVAKLQVGSGSAAHTLVANSAFVKGDLEVDGFLYGNGSQMSGIPTVGSIDTNNVPRVSSGSFVDSQIYSVAGNVGVGTSAPVSTLQINGSFAVLRKAPAVGLFPYQSTSETVIGVTDTTSTRTVTLATADCTVGRVMIIKDESGNAAANNITVNTQGGENIDNSASVAISANYGVVRVYATGSKWFTF
jgi:hypothetical protein